MKKLALVRHGHAVNAAANDHCRDLTVQGLAAVHRLAPQLSGDVWDVMLCSDSQRTVDTAKTLQSLVMPEGVVLHESNALYLAGYDAIYSMILSLVNECDKLVVIGHNPGLSDMASRLTGTMYGLSPADCALLSYSKQGDWSSALVDFGSWVGELLTD